ncbi:hypothetical protein JW890_08425 [candidate division WOR-3 bacterium]|nr:hypothetical protein [candidate division WOR-3 bacterium]
MNKISIFLVLTFSACVLCAGTIEEIREAYNEANEMIKNDEYYRTDISVNSHNLSFPAVGIYNRQITMFWESRPWSETVYGIVKIHIKSEISAAGYYDEYLFDEEGNLIFCYREGGYDEIERRYYFSGDRLLRLIAEGTVHDNPDEQQKREAADVLKAAEGLKIAFNGLHNYN